MAQQIEGIEMLAADGKAGRQVHEMACDEILRIFDQFFLRQHLDPGNDGVGADKGQYKTANTFNEGMRALEKQADLENLVNAALVHGSPRSMLEQVIRKH